MNPWTKCLLEEYEAAASCDKMRFTHQFRVVRHSWLILDWLIFCTLTPRFVIIPGTEGMAEYQDYSFHFRGFVKRPGLSILGGLIVAVIVYTL